MMKHRIIFEKATGHFIPNIGTNGSSQTPRIDAEHVDGIIKSNYPRKSIRKLKFFDLVKKFFSVLFKLETCCSSKKYFPFA